MSMKNPLTPAGIEPATFRFVARYLNHCATTVPPKIVCFDPLHLQGYESYPVIMVGYASAIVKSCKFITF